MWSKRIDLPRMILDSEMRCLSTAAALIPGAHVVFDWISFSGPRFYVRKVTIYASTCQDLDTLKQVVDQVVQNGGS